ncbi:MAG: hypothetical protein R3264_12395, partial [Anaerolineae bacterium]|nr:hypothetical protein [Anaerolineae bacterium]
MTAKPTITGKTLLDAGWKSGPILGTALGIAETLLRENMDAGEVMFRLDQVRRDPNQFKDDPLMGDLAHQIMNHETEPVAVIREKPVPYHVWGHDFEPVTLAQLENAAYLP